jgi:uncharacterized protein (DUF433 family)
MRKPRTEELQQKPMSMGRLREHVARGLTPPSSQRALIVVDPEVCAGKPVVRGTRVPVEYILRMARKGYSLKVIAEEFDLPPRLVKGVLQTIAGTTALQFA